MKYEITVKQIKEIDGERYPTKVDIYTQIVEDLKLVAVINAVNSCNIPTTK